VRTTCQRGLDSDLVPRWGGQDDRNPTFLEVLQEALRRVLDSESTEIAPLSS
jgi:hypothetical protein